MANKRSFPNVSCDTKGGKRYWRYRKNGHKPIYLKGVWGSAEFIASYEAAVAICAAPQPKTKVFPPYTLGALVTAWMTTPAFRKLADRTRADYRYQLAPLLDKHGSRRVTPEHFNTAICQRLLDKYADKPGAGMNVRRRLHTLFNFAVRLGWRTDNPVLATDPFKLNPDGIPAWTEDEVDRFLAFWPRGTWQSLAVRLALETGAARVDLCKFGPENIRNGVLTYRRQKMKGHNGAVEISVFLSSDLLEDLPKGAGPFLATAIGVEKISGGAFGNRFRYACRAAKVEKSPHGLRKTCAVRLALLGCTPHEIAAITGHNSLKEVERYTANANRFLLSKAAHEKKLQFGERIFVRQIDDL